LLCIVLSLRLAYRRVSQPNDTKGVLQDDAPLSLPQTDFFGLNPVQELNGSNGVVANLLTGLRVDKCFTRTDTATSTFLTDALGSTESVWSLPTMARSRRSILTSLLARRALGGAANGNSYQFTGRENDGIMD